ncbi:hypothetical protein V6N13_125410 [Hibiscus sabdariffa]
MRLRIVEEFVQGCSLARVGRMIAPLQVHFDDHWKTPPFELIKINTDGSRNTNSGLATCKIVGRDSEEGVGTGIQLPCQAFKSMKPNKTMVGYPHPTGEIQR